MASEILMEGSVFHLAFEIEFLVCSFNQIVSATLFWDTSIWKLLIKKVTGTVDINAEAAAVVLLVFIVVNNCSLSF